MMNRVYVVLAGLVLALAMTSVLAVDDEQESDTLVLPEEAAEEGVEASRPGLDTANEARERGREFGQDTSEEARERGRDGAERGATESGGTGRPE